MLKQKAYNQIVHVHKSTKRADQAPRQILHKSIDAGGSLANAVSSFILQQNETSSSNPVFEHAVPMNYLKKKKKKSWACMV